MHDAALAHVKFFILSKFFEEVESVQQGTPEREAMQRVALVFALSDLVEGKGWAGLLSMDEADASEAAIGRLLAALRPEAVALVDAFDFTDTILNSALVGVEQMKREVTLIVRECDTHTTETSLARAYRSLRSSPAARVRQGRADGKVYEALYESARTSAMTMDTASKELVLVPPCLDAVSCYLDRDFLRRGKAVVSARL